MALVGKLVHIWKGAETFPMWFCARKEALHGCPQQFGTKTCLKAAASMCGDTNDFKGNKSTSVWLIIIKRKSQPFVNRKKKISPLQDGVYPDASFGGIACSSGGARLGPLSWMPVEVNIRGCTAYTGTKGACYSHLVIWGGRDVPSDGFVSMEMQRRGIILHFHVSTNPAFDNNSEIWGRIDSPIEQWGREEAGAGG